MSGQLFPLLVGFHASLTPTVPQLGAARNVQNKLPEGEPPGAELVADQHFPPRAVGLTFVGPKLVKAISDKFSDFGFNAFAGLESKSLDFVDHKVQRFVFLARICRDIEFGHHVVVLGGNCLDDVCEVFDAHRVSAAEVEYS